MGDGKKRGRKREKLGHKQIRDALTSSGESKGALKKNRGGEDRGEEEEVTRRWEKCWWRKCDAVLCQDLRVKPPLHPNLVSSLLSTLSSYLFSDPVPSSFTLLSLLSLSLSHTLSLALSYSTVRAGRAQRPGRIYVSLSYSSIPLDSLQLLWLSFSSLKLVRNFPELGIRGRTQERRGEEKGRPMGE